MFKRKKKITITLDDEQDEILDFITRRANEEFEEGEPVEISTREEVLQGLIMDAKWLEEYQWHFPFTTVEINNEKHLFIIKDYWDWTDEVEKVCYTHVPAEELLEPDEVACYKNCIFMFEAHPDFETWHISLFQQMSRMADKCVTQMHKQNGTQPERDPLEWPPSRIRL